MLEFRISKDTIKKEKSLPTEWEKTFANHMSDKGLVFRYISNSYDYKRQIISLCGQRI